MNKIQRRLLSGASFAALALGVPQFVWVDPVEGAPFSCQSSGYTAGKSMPLFLNDAPSGLACTRSVVNGKTTATGLFITNTGGGGAKSVTITASNTASGFNVLAKATGGAKDTAKAIGAIVTATGGAGGGATPASTAQIHLTNNGLFAVHASAVATTTTHAVANATATGIVESAYATKTAVAALVNNATISVHANATATGTAKGLASSADAKVVVNGILQFASGGSNAFVNLTNNGLIHIYGTANAVASSNPASATAKVLGIKQTAVGFTTAKATLINHSAIIVSANAHATALNTAEANATVTGISQHAKGATVAEVKLVNSGVTALGGPAIISVVANAHASATPGTFTGNATAYAFAKGIHQSANATAVKGAFASASLVNHGDIFVKANATAVGLTHAEALAFAGTNTGDAAVSQFASGGGLKTNKAVAFMSNGPGAIISAHAVAHATVITGNSLGGPFNATAIAEAWGVSQHVSSASVVSASLINAGIIKAVAFASANAFLTSDNKAFASDSAWAQWQQASNAATGLNKLVNEKSALISAQAIANAHGLTAATAKASAWAAWQSATVGITALASNVLTNAGTIKALASANAHASTASGLFSGKAVATGTAWAAWQSANGAVVNRDVIKNSGNILATGIANAVGTSAKASAGAWAAWQTASGTAVFNTLINSGNIKALAQAHATGTVAHATARATAVWQIATADFAKGGTASNSVVNAKTTGGAVGLISAVGTAVAHGGTLAKALAGKGTGGASAIMGIYQEATGDGFTSAIAHNFVSNQGTVKAKAVASATASGHAIASAWATGIWQSATDAPGRTIAGVAFGASNTVINSGLISAAAKANAISTSSGAATAYAFARGIFQTASGDGGLIARDSVLNSGKITVNATAHAVNGTPGFFGTGGGFASAFARATGISQQASNASFVTAAVSNLTGASINVHASAKATGTAVKAFAQAFGITQSATSGTVNALAFVKNAGIISANANASADGLALGGNARATASAVGIFQDVSATGTTTPAVFGAFASVINTGTIKAHAHAFAEGWNSASATATATGVEQSAFGANKATGSANVIASAFLKNTGIINATAIATAKAGGGEGGNAFASANASGVYQRASNALVVADSAINSGTINANAHASARGPFATAEAWAAGIQQNATQVSGTYTGAFLNVKNAGSINVAATAIAHGGDDLATASAVGISQQAFASDALVGVQSLQVLNTTAASINVKAHALATDGNLAGGNSGTPVHAWAVGVYQSASATGSRSAFASSQILGVTNKGLIKVAASATGTGDQWAFVTARAAGVSQRAFGASFINEFVSNTGAISVVANAIAKTTADAFGAKAIASATGVAQSATATPLGVEFLTVLNSGSIKVAAKASASAPFGPALAQAYAAGISQNLAGASATTLGAPIGAAWVSDTNSKTIDVHAVAKANGATGAVASATAEGITVEGAGGPAFLGIHLINSAKMHIEADATANGFASAVAGGMWASGNFIGAGVTTLLRPYGTMANRGNLTVIANAHGSKGSSVAFAGGMGIRAFQFTGTISNSSKANLHVEAIVANRAGAPTATGIFVGASSGGSQNPLALGTVFNSGTIYAGISFDSGNTFFRGTAINVFNAPNPMAVILDGHGNTGNAGAAKIYGNIFVSTDDTITVQNGKTCFNGVINQPFTTAGGSHAYPLTVPYMPNLYGPAGINTSVAAYAFGALTITANGTLVLVNDPKQGAGGAYVTSYAQSGTLILELRGTDGTKGANTLGKIAALGNANLVGGRVEIVPYAGLYANARTFHAVSAATITGQWTDAGNIPTHSVLLRASAAITNSPTFSTDIITLTRVPFNAVPGLSHNEKALALGIEHIYSTAMLTTNPAFAALIGTLFQVGSAAEYAHDLYQLSGVEHGEQALATLISVRMLNDTVGTHLQLLGSGGSDHVGQLIQGVSPAMGGTGIGKGNIWISGYGNWGNLDQSSGVSSARTSDQGVYAGVDFDVDVMTKVGLVVGATSGEIRFDHNANNTGAFDPNSSGKYSGWHIGIYGRYDADPWYLEGVASYGTYTNDATRHIFIDPSSAALCCTFPFGPLSSVTQGTLKSSYDSHSYSAYGEAGWHWDTGSSLDLTPFLGLSWMHASSDSFAETGLPGANLAVNDATADQFSTLLGARLTTDWQLSEHMVLSPAVRVAWEHQWEGTIWSVDESFAGAPAGGHFTVNGDGYSRDFAVVGLGASVNVSSRVQAVLGYEGRWSSDQKDNSVLGRINFHW